MTEFLDESDRFNFEIEIWSDSVNECANEYVLPEPPFITVNRINQLQNNPVGMPYHNYILLDTRLCLPSLP